MYNKDSYKYDIGIARCVSMAMIVICHIGTAVNNSVIGQLFQVGVQVFILISGLLYGNKDIPSHKEWIVNRFTKICVPCYIFVLAVFFIETFLGFHTSCISLIIYALNLQGVRHIFGWIPNKYMILGCEHLWFITIILLCYILLIITKKLKTIAGFIEKRPFLFLSSFYFVSLLTGLVGIRIDYFCLFAIGIIISKVGFRISRKSFLILSFLMIVSIILRILVKSYCDIYGDNNVYLFIVIPLAYNCLAIWIYYSIHYLTKVVQERIQLLHCQSLNDTLMIFDAYSFYIYIVHYIFLQEPINVLHLTSFTVINYILLFILIILSSIVLKMVSDFIFSTHYHRSQRRF